MAKTWSLRLVPELQKSVETARKTIELRILHERSRWLIKQMLQYQPGDTLNMEFARGRTIVGSVPTTITKQTETKRLGELTDDEVQQIVGLLEITRDQLIELLNRLYRNVEVTDQTEGYLAFFESK